MKERECKKMNHKFVIIMIGEHGRVTTTLPKIEGSLPDNKIYKILQNFDENSGVLSLDIPTSTNDNNMVQRIIFRVLENQ